MNDTTCIIGQALGILRLQCRLPLVTLSHDEISKKNVKQEGNNTDGEKEKSDSEDEDSEDDGNVLTL